MALPFPPRRPLPRHLLFLLLLCICMPASAVAPSGLAPVPPGKTLLFIGQAVEPSVSQSMSGYVAGTGTLPAGFSFYLILSGDASRTRRELATMKAFMDRYPGTVLHLALGYGPGLTWNGRYSRLLLEGRFDPELESLDQWLRALGRPVFLRPLYEFDRVCSTYGGPELYRKAYRYIADRVRSRPDNNIALVLHSAGPFFRLDGWCPVKAFFPGRDYVDYFATSYYTDGPDAASYHARIDGLFAEARALGLPLMIAESMPSWVGTDHGAKSHAWITQYFALIRRYDIRAVSYINARMDEEGGVWPLFMQLFPDEARVQANPAILAAWRRETGDPRFLQATGTDIFAVLRYRPAITALPWSAQPEPLRKQVRWPHCDWPDIPATGGWCLPVLF